MKSLSTSEKKKKKTFRRIILEELMERNYFLYTVLSD